MVVCVFWCGVSGEIDLHSDPLLFVLRILTLMIHTFQTTKLSRQLSIQLLVLTMASSSSAGAAAATSTAPARPVHCTIEHDVPQTNTSLRYDGGGGGGGGGALYEAIGMSNESANNVSG